MDTHTPSQAGIGIATPVCYSEIGAKANQEDALFPQAGEATAQQRVFLVCDGMGGHEHGEVASQCVAHTVGTLTAAQPLCDTTAMRAAFEQALATAYDHLDEIDTPPSEGRTMGTTLTFLALCTDGILIAHIGDSRVYQLRPGEGVVMRTRDHSLVSDLIAAGELTEDEARTFAQRNVITRAIQPHQERRDRATYNVVRDVCEGDVFLLCCDGVVEQLDDEALCALLLGPGSLTDHLAALRDECLHRHTRDNNSAYLIGITSVGATAQPQVAAATPQAARPRKRRNWVYVAIALVIAAACFLLVQVFAGAKDGARQGKTDPPDTEETANSTPLRTIQHR